MTSRMQRRHDAVARTLAQIRRIAPDPQVTDAQLEALKAPLIELARQADLFPPDEFGTSPGKAGNLYELSVDADLRYALYASAGVPGKAQPPHNHTTWALISGVFGDEHNVAYERTGPATIEKRWELTCRRGNAVAFQPDDFHTIEVTGDAPTLHLHLYGRSLAHLPDRVFFKERTGDRWSGEPRRFMARPDLYAPLVGAAELRAMLSDGEEIALVDVRDGGVFARSHLLTASNLPLARLELLAPDALPRRSVRIVLIDDGEAGGGGLGQLAGGGIAQRAADLLRRHGYLNLAVLAGGVPAWGAAGYELFSGTFVPSKAFGEVVEHRCDTPRIEPATLRQWQDEGRKLVVLDSRPMDEYTMMSIPGAIDCPGAELVYRVPALVADDDTTIVVNCAGRTRSIIGAQSLRNAGLRNPIFALKNGTMGWHLAGLKVAKGATNLAPEPQGEALERAKAAARAVAARHGIETIDRQRLAALQADPERTTYLFDVRLPQDFAAGHVPGARSAPGGQLVQSTDVYAPVRGARIVLVDRHGVQAVMTAHWLRQLGWKDVFVLADEALARDDRTRLASGAPPTPALGEDRLAAPQVDVDALARLLEAGAVDVVDVGESLAYRRGHIPGAWYAIRSRLATCLARFAKDRPLVFTCADGRLARYAAADAIALGHAGASALAGGTRAWLQAGRPVEPAQGDDDPRLLCPTEDVWYRPYDKNSGVEQAMQQYLTWEVNLVAQLAREPYLQFAI